MKSRMVTVMLVALWASSTFAAALENLEQRAQAIDAMLRCMVCDGQSLSSSNAEMALEMRAIIRDKLADGQQKDDIIRYFSDRYGDEILMNPPLRPVTYLLWFAPLLFIAIGSMMMWRRNGATRIKNVKKNTHFFTHE